MGGFFISLENKLHIGNLKLMPQSKLIYPIQEHDIETLTSCPVCRSTSEPQNISYVTLGELCVLSTDFCKSCGFVYRRQRPSLSWFENAWQMRKVKGTARAAVSRMWWKKESAYPTL